jgi:uncharacterized protein (DUF427 family)
MRAIWKEATLAESDEEDLIKIEGNWYFPPEKVVGEYFQKSDTITHCPWKGDASHYHISVDDEINPDAAWYYPEPKKSAVEKVGKDFTDYVAFYGSVSVVES